MNWTTQRSLILRSLPYRDSEEFIVIIGDTAGCTWRDTVFVPFDSTCCVLDTADYDFLIEGDSISDIRTSLGLPLGGTIFSKKFHVLDTLYINEDIVFQACTFLMDPDAVIFIQQGSTDSSQQEYLYQCM